MCAKVVLVNVPLRAPRGEERPDLVEPPSQGGPRIHDVCLRGAARAGRLHPMASTSTFKQVQELLERLDRVEQRNGAMPPIWQKGDDEYEAKNKYPKHIQSAIDKTVADSKDVPEEDRLEHMGGQLLSRLRGEEPQKYKPTSSTRTVLFPGPTAGRGQESKAERIAGGRRALGGH